MSKVYEKRERKEPQNVDDDVKNIRKRHNWSCIPLSRGEVIEEDRMWWVNYHCDTSGSHSFGPYLKKIDAERVNDALESISRLRGY